MNSVDSLKAGNTVNMTSRCCSLPAATSVVSTANTIQPGSRHTTYKYPCHCLNKFSTFSPPRWVHHWPCDQGYEQQLASRLFLLWYLPGCARWCWICEECWKVSSSTASHHHSTIIIQFKSATRSDDHVYDAVLSGIDVFLHTFFRPCHAHISASVLLHRTKSALLLDCAGGRILEEHVIWSCIHTIFPFMWFSSHSLPSGTCVVHVTIERKPGALASTSARSATPLLRSSLCCSRMIRTTLITSTATTAGKHAHTQTWTAVFLVPH